jgi:hypothetical protein
MERLRMMVGAYYAERGWNAEGCVPSTQIAELHLTDLAQSPNAEPA